MDENKFEELGEQSADATKVNASAPEAAIPEGKKAKFNWDYGSQDEYNKKKQRRESRRGTAVYVLTALLVFALGFAGIGAVALLDSYTHITQTIEKENVIYVRETDGDALSFAEIAGQVKPSVVVIESMGDKSSAGSGIILSEDGYIATNNHVVSKSAVVKVTLFDGNEYDAEIVGVDALSDLALLKIDAEGLTPVKVGDSDALVVGEYVIAVGNPSGMDYKFTVTDGIISALDRKVEMKGASVSRLEDGYTGVGFAIPINAAMELLDEIKETGKDIVRNSTPVAVRKAVLGITGKTVSSKAGYAVDGVLVDTVHEGYDAQVKGVRSGDIIVGINGKAVDDLMDVKTEIDKLTADDSVTLKIYRDGEYIEITVRLGFTK